MGNWLCALFPLLFGVRFWTVPLLFGVRLWVDSLLLGLRFWSVHLPFAVRFWVPLLFDVLYFGLFCCCLVAVLGCSAGVWCAVLGCCILRCMLCGTGLLRVG